MAVINKVTQLFDNLTDQEANELQEWVEGVILRGQVPPQDPEPIKQWLSVFGYDSDRRLMLISLAVPQRVLISLLVKKEAEFKDLCEALHTDPTDGHKGVMGAVQSMVEALDLATGVPA